MFLQLSQLNLYYALPIFALTLILIQKFRTYRQAHSNGCKPCPHYPHIDPLGLDYTLQNARAFKAAQYLPKMQAAFDRFGKTWQRNFFGTPVIATMDSVNIQSVLQAKDEDWGVQEERKMWVPLFGAQSVFVRDDHMWSYGRTLIKPAINASEYKDFEKFEQHFQSLMRTVPEEDGKSVNMGHVFEVFMAAFGLDYFFGSTHLDCVTIEKDSMAKKVIRAFDDGLIEMIRRSVLGKLVIFMPPSKQFVEHCATIDRFVDDQVEVSKASVARSEKEGTQTRKHVLIDEVIRMGHDREFQQGFLRTLFIGGTDTTQVLLANIMWMLARHPEAYKKLREEVLEAFPGGVRPDLLQLRRMNYLKAVINETFRLHPVTPITNRSARKDTTLPRGGGPNGKSPIFIRKGTRAFLATYAVHRDPAIWGSDAEEFKPERWLSSNPFPSSTRRASTVNTISEEKTEKVEEKKIAPYTFLPFSAGVRMCPGMPLALANAQYFYARFCQEFEAVEARDEREWRDELKITCPNANGVHVALTRAGRGGGGEKGWIGGWKGMGGLGEKEVGEKEAGEKGEMMKAAREVVKEEGRGKTEGVAGVVV